MNIINKDYPNLSTLKQELIQQGHASEIQKVSEKLSKMRLDNTTRHLLSNEPVYVYLLHRVINHEQVTDPDGILNRLLSNSEALRRELYEYIITAVLEDKNLDIDQDEKLSLIELIVAKNPPLDRSEQHIIEELDEVLRVGVLPGLVEQYLKNFPEVYLDKQKKRLVKTSMINKLVELDFDPSKYNQDDLYDRFFVAYGQALRVSDDGNDPIKNMFSSTGGSFDYEVKYFEDSEEQGIIAENILAAGALFYLYIMGEQLGVFRVVDAIILNSTGPRQNRKIYLPPNDPITTKLYNYYKLRDDRSSPEERAMFYKQVLNLGEVEIMENMFVNANYTRLWEVLMQNVVDYIEKSEQKDSTLDTLSRESIYQSTKDLQYNLTHACSGLVMPIIPEINAQFNSAMDILQDKVIVDQMGYGYRKSPWSVIEQVNQELTGAVPNVSAIRTVAIEGHKIFRWISEFDGTDGYEISFDQLLRSAEAFIIAQSQLEGYGSSRDPFQDREPAEVSAEENDEWDF